jgi:hypothetical protein
MKKGGAISKHDGHMSGILFMSIVLDCAMTFCPAGSCQSAGGASAQNKKAATHTRVLILQPKMRITSENSGHLLEGLSDSVGAGLLGVLSRTFEDKGYILRFDPVSMAEWEATPPNDATTKALQDTYDLAVLSRIYLLAQL